MTHNFFVSCPLGLEEILLNELKDLGCDGLRQTVSGVYFDGDLKDAYTVCLWSRLANRVLLPLTQCRVDNERSLYNAVAELLWERDLAEDGTLYIDFMGTNDVIRNTQFGAQTVKDAIVDRIRNVHGERPSIEKNQPDLRVNVRLSKNIAHISLDISGDSLHRRGYRIGQGGAPLKENLAAAILIRSGWPDLHRQGQHLIDPMCGSGTFLIEAAYIAADIAPGILRKHFGFYGWKRHDENIWNTLLEDAHQRKNLGLKNLRSQFYGSDMDRRIVERAQSNIEEADLGSYIYIEKKALIDFEIPVVPNKEEVLNNTGLIICNPPYGERLGEADALRDEYLLLAKKSKDLFPGWQLGVFTGNPALGKAMRLRPKKKYKLYNGTIASELLLFELLSAEEATLRKDLHSEIKSRDVENSINGYTPTRIDSEDSNGFDDFNAQSSELSNGAQMVVNRLRKNQKRLSKWLKKEKVSSYRLYDADMPEYAAAIDIYDGRVHIQEYQAPKTIDSNKAQARFNELIHAACSVFDCTTSELSIKTRKRHKGASQYEKLSSGASSFKTKETNFNVNNFFEVTEGQARYLVNLHDYLDTGLFLDHRPLRRKISNIIKGKSFLNLFSYTSSVSVMAAIAGAKSSVSVDMSNTYLSWAAKNFALNNIKPANHILEQSDVFTWLKSCRQGFDVILLDPPTFSNSKKMDQVLDVQKDHIPLINRCMDLLRPNGVLYFSNNLRSFRLDQELDQRFDITDIRKESLDPDFERNPKIHGCWEIRHHHK